MHWATSFLFGCLIGLVLVGGGWLAPVFLPPTLVVEILQPAYRMPELLDRFIPEVLSAMQLAFGASGGAVLLCFAAWVLATAFGARPTGPGEVGRSWRMGLWWGLLLATLGLTYAAVAYHLTWRLDIVDGPSATRVAVIAMLVAAVGYWLMSFVGAERMMRPAVPLASLR